MEQNKILEKTDEELVDLVLEDQEFFLHIMERYEKKLLSYILRISNISFEEAEDVLQNIFIKVYKNINDFDKSLKFSSWIYRIAHNETINNFRKNKARPQIIRENKRGDDDLLILDKIASNIDIEKEVNDKYLEENIATLLEKIDIRYREVLILKYIEEKDYKEISDILKKPMGTVATLLNRAKKQLRTEIEKDKRYHSLI